MSIRGLLCRASYCYGPGVIVGLDHVLIAVLSFLKINCDIYL